jgi:uncharacterized membrane protein YsdA (DUF1294 family)/cold shock CspA family protein
MAKRSSTTRTGQLVDWNTDRGFGFIQPRDGGEQVFVHVSAFHDRKRRPTRGEHVSFTLTRDEKGRARAARVIRPSASTRRKRPATRLPGRYVLAAGFALLLFAGWLLGWLPGGLVSAYWVMSVLTFSLYALDKAAAQGGGRRTPESSLHILALTGGWPGALLAQQRLRHKTRKQPFGAIFWATVAVNSVALAALAVPGTSQWLAQINRLWS